MSDADLTYELLVSPAEADFSCGVSSIDKMICDSHIYTLMHLGNAYSVQARGIIIGYYMLMLKKFPLDRFDPPTSEYTIGNVEDLCALHIEYLAVRKEFQGHCIGTTIFSYIMEKAYSYSRFFPFRIITLDALEDRISWYEKFHFRKCKDNNLDNPETVTMYYDLISENEIEKLTEYSDGI